MAFAYKTVCVCTLLAFSGLLLGRLRPTEAYEATWESLDARPLPAWYDEAKLGIFIHWGVFSVPSYSSEWFWWYWQGSKKADAIEFMEANYKPDFTYGDFGKEFTAEFFEPSAWAEMFNASGARYIVFVSKHHEGFTNWPSNYSFNWNSMAMGPNRDIVGELRDAMKKYKDNMKFGLYHSLFEWFHPLYLADKASGFKTQKFVDSKTMPELYEIVNRYEPEVVWSDGDWEAPDDYWKSKEFLAWLYTNSSVKDTVVTNDRWGKGIACHHGGYYTCTDRYNPGVIQKHKFENAMTIDRYSWGFRRNARFVDYFTIEELLQTFVTTISCGGNMLMNVGPPKHGHISPIFEERLRQVGTWLGSAGNGEAVYGSKPWTCQNDTKTKDVWYTMQKGSGSKIVYAFFFNWPSPAAPVTLGCPMVSSTTTVTLLGYPNKDFTFTSLGKNGVNITFPAIPLNMLPNKWLWTLKLTNVSN